MSKVNILLFVIDISDPEKYNRSIEEFSWAVNELNNFTKAANIYVLFHKIDRIHEKENITSYLKNKIKKIKNQVRFFETTIFNESLFSVWSDIIQKISPEEAVMFVLCQYYVSILNR